MPQEEKPLQTKSPAPKKESNGLELRKGPSALKERALQSAKEKEMEQTIAQQAQQL